MGTHTGQFTFACSYSSRESGALLWAPKAFVNTWYTPQAHTGAHKMINNFFKREEREGGEKVEEGRGREKRGGEREGERREERRGKGGEGRGERREEGKEGGKTRTLTSWYKQVHV